MQVLHRNTEIQIAQTAFVDILVLDGLDYSPSSPKKNTGGPQVVHYLRLRCQFVLDLGQKTIKLGFDDSFLLLWAVDRNQGNLFIRLHEAAKLFLE